MSLFVRSLTIGYDLEELVAVIKLRHLVFSEQLRWVPGNDRGFECDDYDVLAAHLAAFEENSLVGYVRVLDYSNEVGFMLENEFRKVLGNVELHIDHEKSLEISRLCVAPDYYSQAKVRDLLYKALYKWSKLHNKRYWYVVVRLSFLKRLRRQRFPFVQIGPGCDFGDKSLTVAAVLDLQDLNNSLQRYRPDFFEWLISP